MYRLLLHGFPPRRCTSLHRHAGDCAVLVEINLIKVVECRYCCVCMYARKTCGTGWDMILRRYNCRAQSVRKTGEPRLSPMTSFVISDEEHIEIALYHMDVRTLETLRWCDVQQCGPWITGCPRFPACLVCHSSHTHVSHYPNRNVLH